MQNWDWVFPTQNLVIAWIMWYWFWVMLHNGVFCEWYINWLQLSTIVLKEGNSLPLRNLCLEWMYMSNFHWLIIKLFLITWLLTQRASHPRPPDFHADLWGKSRGSSLRKFPHDFPAEMKEKWRGIFYVDISASFPSGIPGDISVWKFPSCFPQKFQNAI